MTPAQCAADVMTVVPAITRFLRASMRHQGQPQCLSLSQLRVLYFLQRRSPSSLSAVAAYLDVTRPTMSVMIERLVQRGLVQRTNDPIERRRIALSLTPQGKTELDQVYNATLLTVADRLQGLSEPELVQISASLGILGTLFDE
jgi:DNA-binding MarR family transcriptional regulator